MRMAEIDAAAEQFREQGFTVLPGLFPVETIRALVASVEEILRSPIVYPENARFHYWRGAEAVPERIEPVVDLSEPAREACRDRRLTAVLREILGDSPRLLKDRVILRPPGTAGFKAHQDYVFDPYCNPNRMLSAAIALDETTAENGALRFYPGTFFTSYTRWQPRFLSDAELGGLRRESEAVEVCQAPGDVVVFHSLTAHESGANRTAGFRRILLPVWNGLSEGDYYERHRRKYLAENTDLGPGFE